MIYLDRNSRILVTGAGGVLGTAILKRLRLDGFKNVFAPSRLDMNLLSMDSTKKFIEAVKPEIIIHLASLVYGLAGNMKNQMNSLVNNTTINNNLFSVIYEHPVERLFFAGTVASYPYPYPSMPLEENFFWNGFPHDGEYGYAMSKRHAFGYLKLLAEEKKLNYTYGVFTNLYGENDRFDIENGHVIPSLVAKAYDAVKNNLALNIWGDGSATRDFLHADDAAAAVLMCLANTKDSRVVNISSGVGVAIRDVSEIVASTFDLKELCFLTDKPTGIKERVVSNEVLRSMGFVQQISIEEGLRTVCEWYIKNVEKVRK